MGKAPRGERLLPTQRPRHYRIWLKRSKSCPILAIHSHFFLPFSLPLSRSCARNTTAQQRYPTSIMLSSTSRQHAASTSATVAARAVLLLRRNEQHWWARWELYIASPRPLSDATVVIVVVADCRSHRVSSMSCKRSISRIGRWRVLLLWVSSLACSRARENY